MSKTNWDNYESERKDDPKIFGSSTWITRVLGIFKDISQEVDDRPTEIKINSKKYTPHITHVNNLDEGEVDSIKKEKLLNECRDISEFAFSPKTSIILKDPDTIDSDELQEIFHYTYEEGCSDCDSRMMYDSNNEEYYCPFCE